MGRDEQEYQVLSGDAGRPLSKEEMAGDMNMGMRRS